MLLFQFFKCQIIADYIFGKYPGFDPFYMLIPSLVNSNISSVIIWTEPQVSVTTALIGNYQHISYKHTILYIDICGGFAHIRNPSLCPTNDIDSANVIYDIFKIFPHLQTRGVFIVGHRLGIASQIQIAEVFDHHHIDIEGVLMLDSFFTDIDSFETKFIGFAYPKSYIGRILPTLHYLSKDMFGTGKEEMDTIITMYTQPLKDQLVKVYEFQEDWEYQILNENYDRYYSKISHIKGYRYPILIEANINDKERIDSIIGSSDWAKAMNWGSINWDDVYMDGILYGKCKYTLQFILCFHIDDYHGLQSHPRVAYHLFDIVSTL